MVGNYADGGLVGGNEMDHADSRDFAATARRLRFSRVAGTEVSTKSLSEISSQATWPRDVSNTARWYAVASAGDKLLPTAIAIEGHLRRCLLATTGPGHGDHPHFLRRRLGVV